MRLQGPLLVQTQKTVMNPQMFQSLKLMELPLMDLRETIAAELEKNPALEVLEDKTTVSLEDATDPKKEDYEYEFFENSSDSGYLRKGSEGAREELRQFLEGSLSYPETLQEHLLWQLRLEPINEDLRSYAELLIQNLDEDGFHKEAPESLIPTVSAPLLARALKLVQSLDPSGTCTANSRESLEVQIDLLDHAPQGAREALSQLELLEQGKTAKAAKAIGCSEAQMLKIFEIIKGLSPFPGRSFSAAETRYVVPDVQVTTKEGEFVIILNDEEIPVLGISPFFMKMARKVKPDTQQEKDPGANKKEVRDFALENIKEARWFINSINQRNHTLLRVSRAIVEFQRPFFSRGPRYLSPLTLKDIADELGIHIATVSRTAHSKYMQTEWGIFELRHFFSNPVSGTGSLKSRFSKEGVKEEIKDIIASEEERLSDQDIVKTLEKRGIHLARRTVAKYRSELDLGSSFDRKA